MDGEKISGIHNYCDRWCERCAFGSRCAIYDASGNMPPEENDMKNKMFWDRLALNFTRARNFMEEAAQRSGIDLTEISRHIEEGEEKKKRNKKRSEDHPISKISLEYSEISNAWLKSQPGMLDKLEQLREGLTMGTESVEDAKKTTATIKDCLEVIQWYMSFIHVKLVRALMGKADYDGWEEENGLQCDFDGSAKVAVIGIERSVHAWARLFELLPEREDHFLNVLAMLEKLKTMVLNEFPKAMDFRRPGFDD